MPSSSTPTTMSPGDFARLDDLERRIAVAWDEAALALAEIKTGKLYRTTRDGQKQTWDEYCQRVHGITPQWANTLIKRAKTLQNLNAESESPLSLSPTAVGHLEGLPPHEQAEVVKAATKYHQAPTAKDVAEAKHEKLMDRFKPGGDMHQTKQSGKKKEFAGYLVTVVTPDEDELKMFGSFLPSPITDFKARSVAGWVTTEGVMVALEGISKALAAALPKKLRMVVERG